LLRRSVTSVYTGRDEDGTYDFSVEDEAAGSAVG
jgi:hypothetical protein